MTLNTIYSVVFLYITLFNLVYMPGGARNKLDLIQNYTLSILIAKHYTDIFMLRSSGETMY